MNNNVLVAFIFYFLSIGFLHALSTKTDSLTSSRYLKLPVDFYQSGSSFEMAYGVKDNWELGLELYGISQDNEIVTVEDQWDFITNYTFDEGQWIESHDSISYTQKTIDTYSAPTLPSIAIDFKKFFFNKESQNQSRNFYFLLSNNKVNRSPRHDEAKTIVNRSMTYELIDIPDEPQNGDVFGEFYTPEEETIVNRMSKNENIKNINFQLGLGVTFDRKLKIFNVPDFFFCADIHLLQISYHYSKGRESGTELDKYSGLIESYETIDENSSFIISGPSLSIHLKYFF